MNARVDEVGPLLPLAWGLATLALLVLGRHLGRKKP